MDKLIPSSQLTNPQLGAVVLCGGQSARLGTNKSELLLHGRTFLSTIVDALQPVVKKIILVGDVDPNRHAFPAEILTAQDQHPGCGPLEGIRVGLMALQSSCEFAFVTSCDVPLLTAEVISYLWRQLDGHDAIVPFRGPRRYGMTAIYRTSMHVAIGQRIQAGQLRVSDLTAGFQVRSIPAELLRGVDPELDSLTNINSMGDYHRLVQRRPN